MRSETRTGARSRRTALAVACLLALTLPRAAGAATTEPEAQVTVYVDEGGRASVSCLLPAAAPAEAPVLSALGEALGCALVAVEQSEDEDGSWLTARCTDPLPRRGLTVDATLRPRALAAAVRVAGVQTLTIEVVHPKASFSWHPGWRSVRPGCTPQCLWLWQWSLGGALPEVLELRFGYSSLDLALRVGLPLALLLLPPPLVWWLRRRALSSPTGDPAVLWFRFMRSLRMLSLGVWLTWIAALWLADTGRVLGFLLWPGALQGAVWVTVALYFVPPGLVNALLTQLAYPVLRGIRGMDVTRLELLSQAWWTQAALVLPLLLAVAGFDQWTRHASRPAVGLWACAGAVFLVASRRRGRAMHLEPHACTEGELRDRIFALAAKGHVSLRQIYVLPALKARLANALAAAGNVVLLTDYLLQHLSRREVDAVVAHELSHLKRRHPQLLVLLAAVMIVGASFVGGGWHGLVVPLGPALAILAVLLVSRWFERSADVGAVKLTGDPEALITALVKLASLNLLPIHWGKLDEALLTHPSVRRRAASIARAGGVRQERLEELLRGEGATEDRYPLPRALTEPGRVFSTSFKRDASVLNTWVQILAATVTPAVVAAIAGTAGRSPWPWYAAGATLTVALCLSLANTLPPHGQRRLGARLASRLEAEGFPGIVKHGVFVGLAPAGEVRLYESNLTWDMGFVAWDRDRLGYVGELARFALSREEITDVRLGPPHPGWWSTGSVLLEWRDASSGVVRSLQLRPAGVRSLSELRRQALELLAQVQIWWRGESGTSERIPELDGLAPPAFTEVTSQTPRQSLRPGGCLLLFIVVELVAAGLAVLFGLRLWSGVYVFCVAALAVLLLFVPSLLHRERPAR